MFIKPITTGVAGTAGISSTFAAAGVAASSNAASATLSAGIASAVAVDVASAALSAGVVSAARVPDAFAAVDSNESYYAELTIERPASQGLRAHLAQRSGVWEKARGVAQAAALAAATFVSGCAIFVGSSWDMIIEYEVFKKSNAINIFKQGDRKILLFESWCAVAVSPDNKSKYYCGTAENPRTRETLEDETSRRLAKTDALRQAVQAYIRAEGCLDRDFQVLPRHIKKAKFYGVWVKPKPKQGDYDETVLVRVVVKDSVIKDIFPDKCERIGPPTAPTPPAPAPAAPAPEGTGGPAPEMEKPPL